MAHLFVIPGHGAGDSGACGNGYQEQERVRALAQRIKDFGGDEVTLADFSRDYYADNGISNLNIPSDWQIVELHMDSAGAGARGGHVIIKAGFDPDGYDKAIESFIARIFPGRSRTMVGRSDLANPNRAAARGYGYRLVENGFISDTTDVEIFNSRMDEIARCYCEAFGIGTGNEPAPAPTPTPAPAPSTDIDDLARRVINGEFGNGQARKDALGGMYDAVQARVNEMLGYGSSAPTTSVDIEALARAVINGDYGNGQERKDRLGANYDAVQARVNQILLG